MARVFIIRPFGKKKDSSGVEVDFDLVQKALIDVALKTVGLGGGTTGQIVDSGNIREDMFELILEADVVVCDITVHNANVFYELGIRHALRKKRTVMIKGSPIADGTPFDLLTDRYLEYPIADPGKVVQALCESLTATLASDRPTDSPVFQMIPTLPEADWAKVQVIPADFREEVERAHAAQSKGWLRLLSEEVKDRRFQWGGLKLVAQAQWDLKDWPASRASWEAITAVFPTDIDANLALANIYERLSREPEQSELLKQSDQALKRVANNPAASAAQRSEALALGGRNRKTVWNTTLRNAKTVEERRGIAANRDLLQSYEDYKRAFMNDLNQFYPAVVALQMGTLLLDLSKDAPDAWPDLFDDDVQATEAKARIPEELAALRGAARMAVDAALANLPEDDGQRLWASISAADLMFLAPDARSRRVVEAYRKHVPVEKPFAWDAARGQLQLFADLGYKIELAQEVITNLDERAAKYAASKAPAKPSDPDKPLHLLVIGGHRIDESNRPVPRFPASKEARAREMLKAAIESLKTDTQSFAALASAAPGTDILAHEICQELSIPSSLCLPIPPEQFAAFAFGDLDGWRNRFVTLQQDLPQLVLTDANGTDNYVPRWLHGADIDAWERGNRWVTSMALTWGAKYITFLLLWDGKTDGDARGGTAHMVELARKSGPPVKLEIVDATKM